MLCQWFILQSVWKLAFLLYHTITMDNKKDSQMSRPTFHTYPLVLFPVYLMLEVSVGRGGNGSRCLTPLRPWYLFWIVPRLISASARITRKIDSLKRANYSTRSGTTGNFFMSVNETDLSGKKESHYQCFYALIHHHIFIYNHTGGPAWKLFYPRVVSNRYSYSDSDFFDHIPLGVCSDKPNKPTHVYS